MNKTANLRAPVIMLSPMLQQRGPIMTPADRGQRALALRLFYASRATPTKTLLCQLTHDLKRLRKL